MAAGRSNVIPVFGLRPPGDPLGLSCGPEGAALGPISLLAKTEAGFTPRPVDELDYVLSETMGRPTTGAGLESSLSVIAEALNSGDLPRAMIATQQMRLSPLSTDQAARANKAEALIKVITGLNHAGPRGRPIALAGDLRRRTRMRRILSFRWMWI